MDSELQLVFLRAGRKVTRFFIFAAALVLLAAGSLLWVVSTLAAELTSSFIVGAIVSLLAVYFIGKRVMRKKLGGMLDLVGASYKMQVTSATTPVQHVYYSTEPPPE